MPTDNADVGKMTENVIILDNGGATIRCGLASSSQPLSVAPNASAKLKGERSTAVADQILGFTDPSSVTLRRPIERGFVTNWDLEKTIWERIFKASIPGPPHSCGLVVTEPLFNLPALQSQMDQVVFEEFRFPNYLPMPSAELSMQAFAAQQPDIPANAALCGLVIDCGFSATQVSPVFDGNVLLSGVRRINIGGKALTNYLKELVSYRSINMMEETYLMEHIKEATCFVSQDLDQDLADSKKGVHSCEYVLPDGMGNGMGYLRKPLTKEQMREAAKQGKEVPALQLNNERFQVPELIFHPSDVGMQQGGLAEAVLEAANAVHPDLRPLLFSNIVCTGGTSTCPGFSKRLSKELRQLVPIEYEVNVRAPRDPTLVAWQGGSLIGGSSAYAEWCFSKAEYQERGSQNMRQAHGY